MEVRSALVEHGYITHLPWQRHYIAGLNPHLTRFLALDGGVPAPRVRHAAELAFGQGLSLVIHAAANPKIGWTGNDLNAAHVARARALVPDEVTNLQFIHEPFAEFCRRRDLPQFDHVGLTGTWSWIPERAWDEIGCFLARNLAPEGLFCVDYMTLPGQRDATFVRHMMAAFAGPAGGQASHPAARVSAALSALSALMEQNASALRGQESVRRLIETLKATDPAHVEHEYLNHNWNPVYFSEMASRLNAHGLSWGCSWRIEDHVPDLDLAPRQQAYLGTLTNKNLRQQALDALVNRSGRHDIWYRAGSHAGTPEPADVCLDWQIILAKPVSQFPFVLKGLLGEVVLARQTYEPALAKLAEGFPLTLRALMPSIGPDPKDTLEVALVLLALHWVHLVNPDEEERDAARRPAAALNARLLSLATADEAVGHLASPVTGGGIEVPRHHQLFLNAFAGGARSASALCKDAGPHLPGHNSAILLRDAAQFLESYLSIYAALQVTAEGQSG